MDLLRAAEEDARLEEDTSTLSSELLATASLWARAGFPGEAERIWNQLMDVACGVYYRKDYQFNEILVPMELAHGQDPEGTLGRVEEQLILAHQLADAARAKTVAIAIEDLIAFSTRVSPSLCLEMLFHEDHMVFRVRAVKSLIEALLKDPRHQPPATVVAGIHDEHLGRLPALQRRDGTRDEVDFSELSESELDHGSDRNLSPRSAALSRPKRYAWPVGLVGSPLGRSRRGTRRSPVGQRAVFDAYYQGIFARHV